MAQERIAITDDSLLPEWTDERKAITVDQLMRGTSGLTWDETYSLGTAITQMLYAEPDMAPVRREPTPGAPAGHLPAVHERRHEHPGAVSSRTWPTPRTPTSLDSSCSRRSA